MQPWRSNAIRDRVWTAVLVAALAGCSDSEFLEVSNDAANVDLADVVTGKFTPPGDQTLVIIGQTADGINYYLNSFAGRPYGVTMYTNPILDGDGWNLPNGGKTTQSASYRNDYGTQSFTQITSYSQLSDSAVAVGLYVGYAYETDVAYGENLMRDVVYPEGVSFSGLEMRDNIRQLITDLKGLARPVFLRIGYEAEGYWNGHWPDAYKKVWQFVKAEITAQNATNIATVWQLAAYCESLDGPIRNPGPLIASDPIDEYANGKRIVSPQDYDDWYPGDNLVDWTGISIFTQGDDCAVGGKQGYEVMQEVVDYLRQKGKPIIVAESAPKGYDLAAGVFEQVGLPKRTGLSGQAMWNEWFQPYFDFIRQNKDVIRAIAYINDDWEQYNHWQCTTDDNGNIVSGCLEDNWNNSRLDVNPVIQNNWNNEMATGGYVVTPDGAGDDPPGDDPPGDDPPGDDPPGDDPGNPGPTTRKQAEEATSIGGFNPGYPGAGTVTMEFLNAAESHCWTDANLRGATQAAIRYAAATGGLAMEFEIRDGGHNGTVVASANVGNTGTWQTLTTQTLSWGNPTATNTLCVRGRSNGNIMAVDFVDVTAP